MMAALNVTGWSKGRRTLRDTCHSLARSTRATSAGRGVAQERLTIISGFALGKNNRRYPK